MYVIQNLEVTMAEKTKLKRRKPKLRRRRILSPEDRIPIGAEVNAITWRKFRAHCVENGFMAGELLDDLMRKYLARMEKGRNKNIQG